MNYKWTERLIDECRNRHIVPWGKMSAWARRALLDNLRGGKVEAYTMAGWIQVRSDFSCRPDVAYRINPCWNPLKPRVPPVRKPAKKEGAK